MNVYSKEIRAEARRQWVNGEASLNAISRRLKITRQTLLRWRMEEDWDGERNEVEQALARREIDELAAKREQFQASSLKLWAFLHNQMYLRAKRYGLENEMPLAEALDMAKVLASCQTGFYMALGIDPQYEARHSETGKAPRRVVIDYDPLVETLAVEYKEEADQILSEKAAGAVAAEGEDLGQKLNDPGDKVVDLSGFKGIKGHLIIDAKGYVVNGGGNGHGGHTNGHGKGGNGNGGGNGHGSGHANGHGNGHTNGHNGHGEVDGEGSKNHEAPPA